MTALELLVPARNYEIGIAAVDCGADAVYIAGPSFGARKDAGNPVEDIARLCSYAHRFGVRIFVTVNTIVYDNELTAVGDLLQALKESGADGFIVQDLAVLALARERGISLPLHASTQCAIRTPEKARVYESLGFSRLVLERQLSLPRIRAIRAAVSCEIESFVHGALCVSYSGQCYMSQAISGRSGNRGACIQACRSRYDLVDDKGRVIVRDKALLSLKDLNLKDRIEDLAGAGVCSFKVEGRLKDSSYVRNVTRDYSLALDALCARRPEWYCRASYGIVTKGFTPDLDKTFNRDYTSLYLDGSRGSWAAMDVAKNAGEKLGTVEAVRLLGHNEMELTVKPGSGRGVQGYGQGGQFKEVRRNDKDRKSKGGCRGEGQAVSLQLSNGDGFAIDTGRGLAGFRGDVCSGLTIRSKFLPEVQAGMTVYRNADMEFEKKMEANPCVRQLRVRVRCKIKEGYTIVSEAVSEDGRQALEITPCGETPAWDRERMLRSMGAQIGRASGIFLFTVDGLDVDTSDGSVPFLSLSSINAIRRNLAATIEKEACSLRPMMPGTAGEAVLDGVKLDYTWNISNHLSREIYEGLGATVAGEAFELWQQPATRRKGAFGQHGKEATVELMRSRYCIRYELGLCSKAGNPENNCSKMLSGNRQGKKVSENSRAENMPENSPDAYATSASDLYLLNNKRKLRLSFDCRNCEMIVTEA